MKNIKVLIDANILVDVFEHREPYFAAANALVQNCYYGKIQGSISALTFPNLVYIMRKSWDPDSIREKLWTLLMTITIEDLTSRDLLKATELDFSDYEDAVQSVCASRIHADYIVTRNRKDFQNSVVPAILPEQLLELARE